MANRKAKKTEDIALLELPDRDQRRLETLRWFREQLIRRCMIPLSVLDSSLAATMHCVTWKQLAEGEMIGGSVAP